MKLKNISIGDFIEAKNKHGGDVGLDVLEIGKSYEVLGFNEDSDLTVIISVPDHKTFSDGFYVCHECFRKPKPQLKQLDQSVFKEWADCWKFFAIDEDGDAWRYREKPQIDNGDNRWSSSNTVPLLIGRGYDASNWQDSLIERDITKELTGSELCKAMLGRGDKFVVCKLADTSEADAISNSMAKLVTEYDGDGFYHELADSYWYFAVPINNQGEPLTASEVGL